MPRSALAKKIQKARRAAEKEEEEKEEKAQRAELLQAEEEKPKSRRERIQAKFLSEEKQWKKDALLDTDARIVKGMKALGF